VPEEELPFEEAPVSEIAEEEIIEAEVVVSEVPEEELPFEEAPVSEIAEEEIIEAEAIVSEVPEEELPIEEAPVSEVAEEEVIEAEAVVLEVPEEELPIEEAPVSEIPEGEISEKEAPTVEIPVEQKLPLKAPVTRLLVEEMPMAEPEEKTELVVIDLNHASLVELERIPGVGFIKAQNIINYRNEHGSFESVDDLVKVSGFDVTLIDSIKSKLNVLAQAEEPAEISPEEEISTPLLKARNDLQLGKIPEAIDQYQELINTKTNLDEIAFDLQVAIDQYPTDTLLWQTLGDTCVRLGKLQDALNAYTQAEKLLR
ncbi:MAG: helix-hairpin-helix domain-containing protein, partial [Anaerolineales bacterium]|nr:helix-hairpin-helix domain-containing protein [Anaerolineales bacterium]